jgi:hypothetical protein
MSKLNPEIMILSWEIFIMRSNQGGVLVFEKILFDTLNSRVFFDSNLLKKNKI